MRALLRSGVQFQSTLPARGATEWLDVGFNVSRPFQSTLPARGATRNQMRANRAINFNPRSPHGERRRPDCLPARLFSYFNPRSPHGGATQYAGEIRIAGGNFNPRSPHGERPAKESSSNLYKVFQSTLPARGATSVSSGPRPAWTFQSTLPARGATLVMAKRGLDGIISIHAPRTGSDSRPACVWPP